MIQQIKISTSFDIENIIANSKNKFSTDFMDFNMFLLNQDIFPNILKIAKIKPIFKNGDKSVPSNY